MAVRPRRSRWRVRLLQSPLTGGGGTCNTAGVTSVSGNGGGGIGGFGGLCVVEGGSGAANTGCRAAAEEPLVVLVLSL
jgi:hypothetical protein